MISIFILCILVLVTWLAVRVPLQRRKRRKETLSKSWRRAQSQAERDTFDGVVWNWTRWKEYQANDRFIPSAERKAS